MYETITDPYCYPNTSILINKAGNRNQKELDRFELSMSINRFSEPLPSGRFSVNHYRFIHHHLFQDVYPWAGKIRNIRISKSGSMFCYPENIKRELTKVFDSLRLSNHLTGLEQNDFVIAAAHVLAELNAIHAFRDGNGRVQLAFLALLSFKAGHQLNFTQLNPGLFLKCMIESFKGNEVDLVQQIKNILQSENSS